MPDPQQPFRRKLPQRAETPQPLTLTVTRYCPKCGNALRLDRARAERPMRCPGCGRMIALVRDKPALDPSPIVPDDPDALPDRNSPEYCPPPGKSQRDPAAEAGEYPTISPPAPALAVLECTMCHGQMIQATKPSGESTGCLLMVVGVVFTPLLVGILVLIYGAHVYSQRSGVWRCRSCGFEVPRAL